MALYFLEYDLVKQKNYQPLYDELERLNAKKHLLSAWSFKGQHSGASEAWRDHFRQFIDADDRLMVSEVTDWAGTKLLGTPHNT
ncbi:hypothetical protein [Comamonas avium]|uniref:NIPSNAP domain-containing protein n=1 Tax=Comamonas avium TaxID=2762231 RepID=A0ABR8SF56_9BURK|nr:hypothetical protein [Comamonas avium]MBD7962121.1 hypothetical protein [Comamonas avium]